MNKGFGHMAHHSGERDTPAWRFLAHRLGKQNRIFGNVLNYWDSLRSGATLPARADLDPRVIQSALPNAFILDRARPGSIRMRVAGGHLNDLMGMEVRGMPIRAFFDLTERRRLMALVETVFTAPSLLELDLMSDDPAQEAIVGKMLILPMRDQAGQVSKALGCLVTAGTIGQAPRRFKIHRETLTPIDAVTSFAKDLPPASAPLEVEDRFPVRGFAEPVATFKSARAPAAPAASPELVEASDPGPVPWLRIVR